MLYSENMANTEANHWSFLRIQLMGTLPGTLASRRYEARFWRSLWVYLLLGGFVGLCTVVRSKAFLAFLLPVTVLVIGIWAIWSVRSFLTMLKEADELERQIHLEAIAIVLGVGIAASLTAGVASYLYGWTVNPGWFYLLEILRGVLVGLKAKQYAS